MKTKQKKIGVRPETYDKFNVAVTEKHWTFAETADIAITRLLESEKINPSPKSDRRRKQPAAA